MVSLFILKFRYNKLMTKQEVDVSNFYDFTINIKSYFDKNSNTIHKARNELKIIHFNKIDVVVKSFKIPNIIRKVIYTYFRDSKAKKSYMYSLKIKNFTPKPISYIEFYKFGLLKQSYFISERFHYDFTIREPLLNFNFDDREGILRAFARFTKDLHSNNILHKDYSPGNILIKKIDGKYIFKIVDINRMEFKKLPLDERLKNFAKLWLLDEDLAIIVKEYVFLIHEDEKKCLDIALKYSHALKNKINMKKRLKGIKVVD